MKELVKVMLVVAMIVTAGSASAAVLPLVNGDFETQPAGGFNTWVTSIPGWDTWPTSTFMYVFPDAGCPDGGEHAMFIGEDCILMQYTDHVIELGKTYTMTTNGKTVDIDPARYFVMAMVAVDDEGGETYLSSMTLYPADWAPFGEWKTYSPPSYTETGANVGKTLMVYFGGKSYCPAVDSIQLNVTPEPATMSLLAGGMVLLFRRRR